MGATCQFMVLGFGLSTALGGHQDFLSCGKGGGFGGAHRPTCSAASTLVLCGQRGVWTPCI